jgi:hypothetical protein
VSGGINKDVPWEAGPLDFLNDPKTSFQTVLYEPKGYAINSCTAIRPFEHKSLKRKVIEFQSKEKRDKLQEKDDAYYEKYKEESEKLRIGRNRQIIATTSMRVSRGVNNTADVFGV